ncbi:MAG: S4 domain-containing protein, partial [Coprococcus sp.]
MESYNIEADSNWENKRIDKALSDYFDDYSRSFLKGLFADKLVCVNGIPVKPSYKVSASDLIDISIPEPHQVEIVPEDIPLDIVYEDNDIIIINKPKGMVVHPAPGHYTGTLVNGLMHHFQNNLSTINGEFRPGIVHRIDMD